MKRFFYFSSCLLFGILLAILFVVFPHNVHAQANTSDSFGINTVGEQISVSTPTTDLRVTIVRIINIFLGFLGLIAVIIVLYGGYLYMTSRGDEEQIAGAKKLLVNGAIGLAIIMASFGITSFVLSRLQSALNETGDGGGGGGGGDPAIIGSCSEPGTPYYEQYHNTTRCNGFCALYPLQCCTSDNFVVKSITPHTPGDNEFTQMNNTTIRVLFSKRVAGVPESIFKIYSKDNGNTTDITDNFTFSFAEDGSLVEAHYTSGNIPVGTYAIEVNSGVRDISGNTLTTQTSCGTFATSAEFKTGDNPVVDSAFTGLDPLSIDDNDGDSVYSVVQGSEYPLQTTLHDDHGNAYAFIRVYKEGEPNTILEKYIDGPRVSDGSSKSFVFVYGIRITSKFTPGVTYVAEVIAHDIDGNTKTDTVKFRTVPPTCRNGVLDPGEGPEADQGGVCGETEGNTCHTQSDCSYSLKCLDVNNNVCGNSGSCTCKTVPYISKIEYMNGAAGNWITIFGKNFGTTPGVVKFNYDFNRDNTIDSSVTASLAQCREGNVWGNSWIIAEVPPQPEGAAVSPSISVIDSAGLSDASNDNFGPNLGLFSYTNTVRPNLCSVTVASDQSVTLDDGTVTTIHAGDHASPQGAAVNAEGKAFGSNAGSIKFSSLDGRVASWSESTVASAVPFGSQGELSVYIAASNGEKSNSVPFTVLSTADLHPPTITSIDPSSVTKGSYITISGNGFGNSGHVYFSKTEGATCPVGGCILAGSLPQTCGNTWSNTQVVAKVPTDSTFDLGTYFVIVVRDDNTTFSRTSGKESVVVVSGSPAPSICRIDPIRGSAPILGTDGFTVYGENFITNSQVKFWFPLAQAADPDSWLSSSLGTFHGGASIAHITSNKIETGIPYDLSSGLSMSSGPIKIKNSSGVFSNSIRYDVLDCRESTSPKIPGFQCCTEGPETGRWKQGNFACQGGSREAGYVWRFTTGKVPQKFFVQEMCSEQSLPSPSPSTLWESGTNVCVNAQLQVSFNLPLNLSTIFDQSGNLSNLSIANCGGTGTAINCTQQATDVTNDFSGQALGADAVIFRKKNNSNLSPNTWYRIGLSFSITSLRLESELGQSVQKTEKLESTRSCEINGTTFAYCFDFRTGPDDFMCSLVGAGMEPAEYTTTLLGIVQDPRSEHLTDLNRVFDISALRPLVYGVYGKANLACTSLNVDNKPWVWGPVSGASATAAHMDLQPNSKGYATAWENNVAGSSITAKVTENNQEFTASSTLKIDLGNPYAKTVWPSCIEACVNAEIGIEFNQIMDPHTYDTSKIKLHECASEACVQVVEPAINLVITPDLQNNTTLRAYPVTPLKKNTWYVVDLGEGVRAVGGVTPEGVTKLGSSADAKQWKFRTKDSAQLCLADSVHISPDPFFSTYVGQAQLYRALPAGSPDSCSPYGQQLNPWDYGWNWSIENTNVAKVSNFSFAGGSKLSCTIGCTPKGSDISREQNQSLQNHYPVCGNGRKDEGEDCDIALPGEKPGVSCSFSCLRPGNNNADTCGNGVVETSLGEQCDPKDTRSDANSAYCSNTCLYTGSSKDQTGVVNVPVCGSGGVTYGESCDTGSTQGSQYCSSKCLNFGTSISQAWCDGWIQYTQNPNSVSSAVAQQYAGVSQTVFNQVCKNATSVCGNGIVEQGEECDNDSAQCSSQCLVQNACNTSAAQCVKGSQGCLSDCTFAGSSVTYQNPSICGDGVVGIGEYGGDPQTDIRSCELLPGEASNILGQNPVQIVTSVGNIESSQSGSVSDMQTQVTAQTDRAWDQSAGVPTSITGVTGSGEYHLQCGYTEYDATSSPYNNCPSNANNTLGVGANSCCSERPQRINEYPSANAGLGASAPVCRNTYISVTFDQNIPSQYVQNNIKVIQGFDPSYSCSAHGGTDVTPTMKDLLALNTIEDGSASGQGVWAHLWNSLKIFFVRLFHTAVMAAPQPNQVISSNLVWCSGVTPFEAKPTYETDQQDAITHTTISVYPGTAFEINQFVVVLLNGGKSGIKNSMGVSIKSPFGTDLSDYWIFKTGDQVCKIKQISVDPTNALFTTPNSSKQFIATAQSIENQKIVSIPGQYEWTWNWAPQNDSIFDIPVTGDAQSTITSKGVRGHTDGVVKATVVRDVFQTNNQEGKSFDTVFSLDALFCQRPWPANGVVVSDNIVSTTVLFTDPKYNFSMYYCADSGSPLSVTDDLPYFHQIEVITNPNELGVIASGDLPEALRRYLLFADKTEDAIGVQIFANPTKSDGSRQTLTEWYVDKFGDTSNVAPASVAGYDALINDFNVYINAFNVDGNSIYNNVYLFSIDTNATPETKQVFQQLISSLRFNINLTNHNRCLITNASGHVHTVRETPNDYTDLACTTDFDCRDVNGAPQSGTNGICSNAATKFTRDIKRLEQMHTVEIKTDNQISNPELNLASGTYIPGYTNSKWPSWGKLGAIIGGAPIDPVNQWAGCAGDSGTCWSVASTTFQCPVYAQTYEYNYNTDSKDYTYYAPFEFVRSSDTNFVSQYIDSKHVSFNRWCTPEATISPFGGRCGDGVVNIGEDCDPPGRTMIYNNSCSAGSYATATCTASCKYSYGICVSIPATCGNGNVEGTEQCDAGSQNGQYGSQCSTDCKVATSAAGAQFCGNNKLDVNTQGKPLEFCENVGGACIHINDNGQVIKTRVHVLLDRSGLMTTLVSGTNPLYSRWVNAINGLDQIYLSTSSTVVFSLSTFNGNSGSTCYQDYGTLTQKPSVVLASAIPSGGTPTNCAMKKIFDTRSSIFGTDVNVPKKLIFITGGLPSDSSSYSSADYVTTTIKKLADNAVSTYVIGFGNLSGISDKHFLNDCAEAGGTMNPNSADKFFTAEKASAFVSTFSQILGCSEYNQYKSNSCSWNCQNYGAYCGDGAVEQQYGEECEPSISGAGSCNLYCKFVQGVVPVCGNSSIESGEQCDDGNTANGDGCSSTCSFETTSAVCGNGPQGGQGQPPLDPGEQCDLGNQNGVVCTPSYGTSCTYCSNRCLNVTVDPVAYCGNNRVDVVTQQTPFGILSYDQLEKCETASVSTTYILQNGGLNLPPVQQELRCPDKGSYTCSNSCQSLQNNCVSCGRASALPIPKIAILNPLTQAGKSPYTATTGYVDLLRMNPPGSTTTTLNWLGYRKINYRSEDTSTYIDPFSPYFLFINAQYQPVLTDGLQTNPSCNGEYFLLFNKNHISKLKTSSDTGMSNVQVVQQGLADLFDYPVNGEAGQITDEVVMSPAIYSNQLRIVTRWKKKNGASSAIFMGELYQDQTGGQAGNTFSYFTHVSTDVGGGIATDLNCGEVRKDPSNYYVATNCEDATKQLIMHKILNPTSTITSVQAVTISTSLDSLNPLGFYVTTPNGPINQLKDYELWVDIYTYHPGQIPDLSIYKPTSSFSIQNAIPSTNPTARYWHVFNLVITGTPGALYPQGLGNRQFTIQPVGTSGAIVTDQCAVRSGMPNTTKCAL